ncbi:hypothetical protein SAMN06272735_9105 [Streptomyces sp. TLI_55]|uniref:hypothetical protein n=1 Tax=Streptomyces sp. TLI_55 TaxID=1938861 RepID=UPI000BCBC898|nr:hypothetical protein [Streptomyces sp. TLI_55]SNX88628.1 hypothetical protein SAMN06272735_9105 [Streptomyces sp. TLI_55]
MSEQATQQVVVSVPDLGLSNTELTALQEKFRNNIVESMQGHDAQAFISVSISVSVGL